MTVLMTLTLREAVLIVILCTLSTLWGVVSFAERRRRDDKGGKK